MYKQKLVITGVLSKTKLTRMIDPLFSTEGFSVLKRWLVITLFCFSSTGFADPLWHCVANNEKGAVWNQYALTEQGAHSVVEKACIPHNNHKTCAIVCFPPRVYWRCLSHDTVPALDEKNNVKEGGWYWTSFSKQIAINGARDACRHNSQYGGCTVDENACSSS